jgi:hypothetical protein
MGVVPWRSTRGGNVLQTIDASTFLDIVGQVTTCTKLHDKIHVLLGALGVIRAGSIVVGGMTQGDGEYSQ